MQQAIKRDNSLDALRGIAILLMVLSSSIAFNILPGWMYHAQVPPPTHQFNPDAPGITWVDLVFPFFLFTMGAAIPLALNKKISQAVSGFKISYSILKRFVLLVFFALFTMHTRAWVLSPNPQQIDYLISILSFVLMFAMYADFESKFGKKTDLIIKLIGFSGGILILVFGFSEGKSFSKSNPDIIMLVLANMALFGTFIWWFTNKNVWLRIGILPFIMAVFLSSKIDGSINQVIFNFTPAAWLYKFYYLKYLFIILPGTLVGEWLLKEAKEGAALTSNINKLYSYILPISLSIVVVNICFLYSRNLELNFIINIVLVALLLFLASKIKAQSPNNLVVKFIYAGSYLLFLGLFFEAFEGGIKKDFSTYSYYFVCTGLAFLTLLALHIIDKFSVLVAVFKGLADVGKNPMIAYTAGNLLLIPLLRITGAEEYLNLLSNNFFEGLLRGLLFTGVVAAITIFFTTRRVFWKT